MYGEKVHAKCSCLLFSMLQINHVSFSEILIIDIISHKYTEHIESIEINSSKNVQNKS